ncbi:MAG: sulfurtransferase [Deltaproteobacteria bacterium]|nr:sulfurtransferase [Deltaproteobacteria bacterium]
MYLNIAAYHFAPLKNLPEMRVKLLAQAKELGLKGTILLTPEGINCFITGSKDAIAALLKTIRSYPELSEFKTKESWADTQPFNRMLVKIKKETISFGIPNATPLKTEAARITPKELKDWYDKNKDFVLLDTRNNFEIEVGAFKNTEHLNMKSFKDFIKAARNKLPEWKDKTIVSVCTGGIRCEKAAPFMNLLGYKNVYQLEGGILKYFEECGSEHYDGDCFVFDKRVALDPELKPSGHGMC